MNTTRQLNKTPKIPPPVVEVEDVRYTIEKISSMTSHLVKVTLYSNGTFKEEVIHKNSPAIVYGKLLLLIHSQPLKGSV